MNSRRRNPENDYEVVSPPPDGVSSLSWSPQADYVTAGSWDCGVRVWEVSQAGQTNGIAEQFHQAPVLDTCWSDDGTKVFSGGCDNAVYGWDLQSGDFSQVAEHDAPVRSIFWCGSLGVLATGSWDGTLRFWDFRQPAPICTHQLPGRVRCMSSTYPLCVVACSLDSDAPIVLFDLRDPQKEFGRTPSPLAYQTRSLVTFADASGYAIGSIEGRVGIQYVQDTQPPSSYAFKCHRDTKRNVYAINAMSVHPRFGTFCTAGSDGVILNWDKDSKQRLKAYAAYPNSISAAAFSANGNFLAYAVSYDWSRGAADYNAQEGSAIYIKPVPDENIRPRPKKAGRY